MHPTTPFPADPAGVSRAAPWLPYTITIFLSAFLLFQVQLLLAKYILPWFGGTPAVWTTSMLFFQTLLLGGYAYAHWLARRSARAQRTTHSILLAASVVSLGGLAYAWGTPLLASERWKPLADVEPVGHILGLLGVSVGLPFFVLSATNPLLAAWWSRAHPGISPYRLYAVSNFGSLLGLISYPLALEVLVPLNSQAWLWAASYAAFATGILWNARDAGPMAAIPESRISSAPALTTRFLWFALPACASLLLLASTNQITQEIGTVPLLWMLPLAVYLLSFVLCFGNDRGYARRGYLVLLVASLTIATLLLQHGSKAPILAQIVLYTLVLFVACMALHGELARLKPSAHHVTAYYLTIAGGGVGGGLFVSILAPNLFSGFWELPLGLWSCAVLYVWALWRDRESFLHEPTTTPTKTDSADTSRRQRRGWLLASLLAYGAVLATFVTGPMKGVIAAERNFYGVVAVIEANTDDPDRHVLELRHGRILHGMQLQAASRQRLPGSYYGPLSGVGLVLQDRLRQSKSLRIGVVGLGVGTLAAYGRVNDYLRFYEINPAVIALAHGPQAMFSYLANTDADVEIVPGDARLVLERELTETGPQKFDILVVDAFSSDAIPVHLLTREAITLYLAHLESSRGVLAFNLSSRYVELKPLVARMARHFGLDIAMVDSSAKASGHEWASDWALLAPPGVFAGLPSVRYAAEPAPAQEGPFWTDNYSNILGVMRVSSTPSPVPGQSSGRPSGSGILDFLDRSDGAR